MNLNHVNLPVENVTESKVFFETFFNFKCVDLKGDNLPAVLKGEDDFTLVLMSLSWAVSPPPTVRRSMQQFEMHPSKNMRGQQMNTFKFTFRYPVKYSINVTFQSKNYFIQL